MVREYDILVYSKQGIRMELFLLLFLYTPMTSMQCIRTSASCQLINTNIFGVNECVPVYSVPGQPTTVTATPTSPGSVVVQWEGPGVQADVDGYVVRYSPTGSCEGMVGGEVEVSGSETTQLELSGMEPGAEYQVSVAAFNSTGTGEFSTPPVSVTITEEGMQAQSLLFCPLNPPPSTQTCCSCEHL